MSATDDCVGGGLIKRLQCRGAEPGHAQAPLDSAGERDFLRERVALWARITFLASLTFFVAGFAIEALWPPLSGNRSFTRPDILFDLATCAVLLLVWLASRQPGLSEGVLRAIDAGGTLATLWLYACIAGSMPPAWRPEMMFLLIVITILLTRAALVPSPPAVPPGFPRSPPRPRLSWRPWSTPGAAPEEVSRGQSVSYALLWSILTVLLSTLASFVTFRLRKSVARARQLGQYTLKEKLGEGGMGVVYRAEHELLRRPSRHQAPPPGARPARTSLKRFEREVQVTARLTHPNTVEIYDYGRTPDGLFYYVMEYLDGIDLEELVEQYGPLPPGRAVHLLRQACAALPEAHGLGLIHRDIKPANIIAASAAASPTSPSCSTSGSSREISGTSDPRLTADNVLHGTPQYLAPEAIRNADSIDARSDLYALAAVGYFLLTGTPVFSGRGALEIIHHHLQTEPEGLSKRLGKPVPPKLEALILRALSKDPDERPESARAFADALHACDDVAAWDELDARRYWRERATRREAAQTA